MLKIESFMNFTAIIPEIHIVAVRSRGPGGQNVNKVSSAAQLFWSFRDSQGLTEFEKSLVAAKLRNWINKAGQLYLRADEFRDLERNKARAFAKLEALLQQALHRPKARRATKPTRASKEKKLEHKARRGEVKKNRRKISWD
jgi:ribosome-associated protein